jgi:hypothetical protein
MKVYSRRMSMDTSAKVTGPIPVPYEELRGAPNSDYSIIFQL